MIANSNLLQSVVNSSDINLPWGEWNSNLRYIIDTCIPKTIVKILQPLLGLTVKHAMYRNVRKRHGVVLTHQTQKVAGKYSGSAEINYQIY